MCVCIYIYAGVYCICTSKYSIHIGSRKEIFPTHRNLPSHNICHCFLLVFFSSLFFSFSHFPSSAFPSYLLLVFSSGLCSLVASNIHRYVLASWCETGGKESMRCRDAGECKWAATTPRRHFLVLVLSVLIVKPKENK